MVCMLESRYDKRVPCGSSLSWRRMSLVARTITEWWIAGSFLSMSVVLQRMLISSAYTEV